MPGDNNLPKVACTLDFVKLRTPNGVWIDGIEVTCTKCQQTAEAFGVRTRSVKRALAVLREKCLRNEKNFYVIEDDKK